MIKIIIQLSFPLPIKKVKEISPLKEKLCLMMNTAYLCDFVFVIFSILRLKMSRMPTAVVDVGTGYTKLGFAGNTEPQFIFPSQVGIRYTFRSVVAEIYSKYFRESANVGGKVYQGLDDLDFHIGNEAVRPNYASKWPLRHGIIEDWDLYERFMEQIIFKYLRKVYSFFISLDPIMDERTGPNRFL